MVYVRTSSGKKYHTGTVQLPVRCPTVLYEQTLSIKQFLRHLESM